MAGGKSEASGNQEERSKCYEKQLLHHSGSDLACHEAASVTRTGEGIIEKCFYFSNSVSSSTLNDFKTAVVECLGGSVN